MEEDLRHVQQALEGLGQQLSCLAKDGKDLRREEGAILDQSSRRNLGGHPIHNNQSGYVPRNENRNEGNYVNGRFDKRRYDYEGYYDSYNYRGYNYRRSSQTFGTTSRHLSYNNVKLPISCGTFGPYDYEAWEQKVELLFYSHRVREEEKFQSVLKSLSYEANVWWDCKYENRRRMGAKPTKTWSLMKQALRTKFGVESHGRQRQEKKPIHGMKAKGEGIGEELTVSYEDTSISLPLKPFLLCHELSFKELKFLELNASYLILVGNYDDIFFDLLVANFSSFCACMWSKIHILLESFVESGYDERISWFSWSLCDVYHAKLKEMFIENCDYVSSFLYASLKTLDGFIPSIQLLCIEGSVVPHSLEFVGSLVHKLLPSYGIEFALMEVVHELVLPHVFAQDPPQHPPKDPPQCLPWVPLSGSSLELGISRIENNTHAKPMISNHALIPPCDIPNYLPRFDWKVSRISSYLPAGSPSRY
ncbi:hypothetical protein M9H77_30627 [Catharanthus roseus]|uniref:Uncharacterized protein n=1 Tax=Catharanthus roseus TaxID=4058 RepID=A0ACB9ZXS2_CATRO|nr:hypothetical protein M9H77_30627 [Catharanthus roseus]